jgi:hypothetical protein
MLYLTIFLVTIQTLSREQVESLGESLFDFNSFDDVVNWLDNV